jgi:heme/copper-type cytochrome/quinol oxidase subunit 4
MRSPIRPAQDIILGVILTLIFNGSIAIAFIMIGSFSASLYAPLISIVFVAPFIGLTQLVYIVPLCIYLQRKGKWNWMKGIIIGACITALLNGGCWLLLTRMGIVR